MKLSADDMKVLFQSGRPTDQIERYLAKQPEGSAASEELREVFSCLSEGCYQSALISLKVRNVIAVEDGVVSLVSSRPVRVLKSDIVWKAIRIERQFSAPTVAAVTGLTVPQVCHILASFEKEGHIRAVYRKKGTPTVYVMVSDSINRPVKNSGKKNTVSASIWKAIRKQKQPFSSKDILRMIQGACSLKYVDILLRQYRQDGLIEIESRDSNPAKAILYVLTDAGRRTKESPKVRYEVPMALCEKGGSNG